MTSAPDPGQAPDPSTRLAAVAAEMTAVFAAAGLGPEGGVGAAARPSAIAALRPGRRGAPPAAVAAAVIAGLAGLGAGAIAFHQPAPAQARAPIQPAPRQAPRAGPVAPAPAAVIARAETPAAASPVAAAAEAPPVKAEVRPAASPPRSRPAAAASRRRTTQTARAQQASCAASPHAQPCRAAVMNADRRLRAVYARAAREGVPNDVLIDYRERWADLREREADRPRQLIVEYRALASALAQERREEEGYRSHSGSPLRGLRTALLSWW